MPLTEPHIAEKCDACNPIRLFHCADPIHCGEMKMLFICWLSGGTEKTLIRAVNRNEAIALYAKTLGILPSSYLHARKAKHSEAK